MAVKKAKVKPVAKVPAKHHHLPKPIKNTSKLAFAVAALIINVVFPGLGSLIGRRTRTGIFQMIFVFLAIFLYFTGVEIIGIPLFAIIWLWGVVTGLQLVKAV